MLPSECKLWDTIIIERPKPGKRPTPVFPTSILIAALLAALTGPALSLTLEFPGASAATGNRVEPLTSYRLPIGPFANGVLDTRLTEGPLDQSAWRIAAPGLTTLQLLQPLRDQIAKAGFKLLYECEAAVCGGFDFRYGTDVLPEPDMHVDLGDFRYLAAERSTAAGPEYISLIVSRAADQGFVQLTRVGQDAVPSPNLTASSKSPLFAASVPGTPPAQVPDAGMTLSLPTPATANAPLAQRLTRGGAQVLEDLVFASGSSALAEGNFASLTDLAAFLEQNPQAKVMLVGHTDASGSLEANIALSRNRAQSVRERLLKSVGIPAAQVAADGVGYLSPRAPNDTEAGRLLNRRVEVMLLVPEVN